MNEGLRAGRGAGCGAAGRGTLPAGARGARTVTATRARARPAAARPRDLRQPRRGARDRGRRRLRGRVLVTSASPTRVPESRAGSTPRRSQLAFPPLRPPGPAPQLPLCRSPGRVLAAHAGCGGPAPPRQFPGRPAGHHGGPEACAAPPGGLTVPERRPWGARVPGRSPAPWPGPSLPA